MRPSGEPLEANPGWCERLASPPPRNLVKFGWRAIWWSANLYCIVNYIYIYMCVCYQYDIINICVYIIVYIYIMYPCASDCKCTDDPNHVHFKRFRHTISGFKALSLGITSLFLSQFSRFKQLQPNNVSDLRNQYSCTHTYIIDYNSKV